MKMHKLSFKPLVNKPVEACWLSAGQHFARIFDKDEVLIRTSGKLGEHGSCVSAKTYELASVSAREDVYKLPLVASSYRISDVASLEFFMKLGRSSGEPLVYLATSRVENRDGKLCRLCVRMTGDAVGEAVYLSMETTVTVVEAEPQR